SLILLDVGIDDAADIVIFVFVVLQERVVLFLLIVLDDDVFDVILVDDLHADTFGLGLLDDFFFLVLAGGGDHERRLVGNWFDDLFGVLALLVLVFSLFVLR